MDSLENKKLGDSVWVLDYADNPTKCGKMIEHKFISWENHHILTMHGNRIFLHKENWVFPSPSSAARKMERIIECDEVIKKTVKSHDKWIKKYEDEQQQSSDSEE